MVFVFITFGGACLFAQLPPPSFFQLKRNVKLSGSLFHSLAEDEYGFIWFGSYHGGGLYRYDGYDLKTFMPDPNRLHHSLTSTSVITVNSMKDGQLYIGTYDGMTILNLTTGQINCIADDVTKAPDPKAIYIEPIVPDPDHKTFWIGSAYGLARFETGADSLLYYHSSDSDTMVRPIGIIDIVVDARDKNILWLGTINGLFNYKIKEHRFEHFPSPFAEKYVVMDLYQDMQGDIWIAGDARPDPRRERMMRYSPGQQKWTRYPLSLEVEGKDFNLGEVYFILPANKDNEFWICTRHSVGILNVQSGKYDAWTYDPARPDGLLPNDVFRTMISDRHGRIWVGSWEGVQYAKNPFLSRRSPNHKVPTAITDIRVSNARADSPKPLLYTSAITLLKDQRDITIRYVLPNPLDIQNVTYAYQLKGRDKDWISTDQRQAIYTELRGGTYTFLVKSKEAHEEWGEITRLPISVEKKYSEYVAFWIFIIALLGGSILGSYRYLIARTRKEEQLKAEFSKKVSEVEMQALRAQMNPHFLFNSLNSIKYFALSKDKDATAEYLTKFSLLVRTILNNSKSHTISLKDELEALQLYIEIEHLRLEGRFEYQLDIDSSIRLEQAQIPPMILQPYVENAIWHGLMHKPTHGTLIVHVKDMGTQIQCIIEDNGIGRAKAREIRAQGSGHKKSMGLQITGDRITLINRIYGIDTQVHVIDLIHPDGEPAGTRVVVNIPLITDDV